MGVMEYFSEFKNKYFWRAVFCELLATTLFVFVVTTASVNFGEVEVGNLKNTVNKMSVETIRTSLPIGFAMAFLLKTFGPISGGHMNPAVSMGAYVNGDVSSPRATMYSAAQYVGGILGAVITHFLTPSGLRIESKLGSVLIGSGVSTAQAFFVEFILTFILTLVFLSCTDKQRKHSDGPLSIIVGITYLGLHFIGRGYTGGSFNPARGFGPSLIFGEFDDHSWIYWVAPYVGSTIAGLLYRFVLRPLDPVKIPGTSDQHATIEMNNAA